MKNSLLAFALLFLALAARAQIFSLTLSIEKAQVDKLILGCHPKATDGYDRGLDIYVPPMGMGTAVVGFQTQGQDILYQDNRAPHLPQTWTLVCRNPGKLRTAFSWDPKLLPKDVSFTLTRPNGAPIDMKRRGRLEQAIDGNLIITAAPLNAAPAQPAPAAPAVPAQPAPAAPAVPAPPAP